MKNVLFVTIDALRQDHVGCFGYDRPTTPHIDAVAERGNARECRANHPGTRWAMQSLMTGVYTLQIDGVGIPESAGTTLAETFSNQGYATAGFANNAFLSRPYGYDRGFDRFDGGTKFERTLHDDNITVTRALDWIQDQPEPWFCWTHLMGPHGPWRRDDEALRQIRGDTDVEHVERAHSLVTPGETPPQAVIDAYDVGIRRADEQVGRLVDAVDDRGQDDTVIVVTADHGEEFGEFRAYHTAHLQWTMTDVPLVCNRKYLNEGIHQHIDIPPLMLGILGVPRPDSWAGSSIPSNAEAEIHLAVRDQVGLIDPGDGTRYVRDTDTGDLVHYNGDQGEEATYGRMTQEWLEWCSGNQTGTAYEGEQAELSDEVTDRLRELGYLQ